MGFFRQEYWSGLPFPPPVNPSDPGIEPMSPVSPALQVDSLPTEPSGKPWSQIMEILWRVCHLRKTGKRHNKKSIRRRYIYWGPLGYIGRTINYKQGSHYDIVIIIQTWQEAVIKTIPKKKKCKKAKWLSEESLQIAEKKVKGKGEKKDIPIWMQNSKE